MTTTADFLAIALAQHNSEVPAVYNPLQLPATLSFTTTSDGSGIASPPLGDQASAAWWRDFGAAALAPYSADALAALAQLADSTGQTTLGAALDVINASTTSAAVRDFVHSYVAKVWAEAAEGYQLLAGTDTTCTNLSDWGARAVQHHETAAQLAQDQAALAVLQQPLAGGGTVFSALAAIPQLATHVGSFCLEMIVPGLPVNGGERVDAVLGGGQSDTIQTSAGRDAVLGFEGNDVISTGDGCDQIWGGLGDDAMDGGLSTDTAVYSGNKSEYTITATAGGFTVSGPEGADTLVNVERIRFADALLAVDTQACDGAQEGGHLWQVMALARAAFGIMPDRFQLSHWAGHADECENMTQLAQQMMNHYAPDISAADLVGVLFRHIAQVQATEQMVQAYCEQIGPGRPFATLADLFARAASLPLNTEPLVGLVGTVQELDPSVF